MIFIIMKCKLKECPIRQDCQHSIEDLGESDFNFKIFGSYNNHVSCNKFKKREKYD
jgi:hypothetical protein